LIDLFFLLFFLFFRICKTPRSAHRLAADVPFRLSALTRSCVVIPCTFWDNEQIPMTRGIWAKRDGGIVFHNGRTQVMHHFRDRTKIVGDLSERNCSLEIDDIKPFDNGPFCFHAERGNEKYTFNNSCVFILTVQIISPSVLPLTVSCSVTHTCPSHSPEFSWSVPHISSAVSDSLISGGIWQRTSIINFIVAPGDGVKNLTCTASFWGEKKGVTTAALTVTGLGRAKGGANARLAILLYVFKNEQVSAVHGGVNGKSSPSACVAAALWE
uniref:Si:dkey-238d18.9 n=1 Tax=Oryzias latipes TaxID=8090 RepID=A0A3P9L9D5_ORYLA